MLKIWEEVKKKLKYNLINNIIIKINIILAVKG